MQYKLPELKKLQIVCYPDPVLTRKAEPILEITAKIADLADRMIDIMIESAGVGLAAPQVGVSLRMFVMTSTGKRQNAEIMINPQISQLQGTLLLEEGCLSLPLVRASVRRASACSVNALDIEGDRFVTDAVDLSAIILQHETDHLDGVLFIDRMNTIARLSCRKVIKQLEDDYGEK